MRILKDWIESYMIYTENTEPPLLYKKWVAISTIAACLQRKCRLERGSLILYPNLYVVLVGRSGKCRKGTAMRSAITLLNAVGVRMAADATTREALIRSIRESTERVDTETSIKEHASLTIYSEELTVFLDGKNPQMMIDMTAWFDCKDVWIYDTKHQGTDKIIGIWINLLGATTPTLISSALPQDAVGGGLTSRMIFVYERKKDKYVADTTFTEKEIKLERDLLIDLNAIWSMKGDFKMTEECDQLWRTWYPAQENYKPFSDERFNPYLERRPSHVLKIAMIVSASRGDDMLITTGDFNKADELLKATEVKMPQTFGGMGRDKLAEVTERVMDRIGVDKIVYFDELVGSFWRDANKWDLERILSTLTAMKFCVRGVEGGRLFFEYKEEETKGGL